MKKIMSIFIFISILLSSTYAQDSKKHSFGIGYGQIAPNDRMKDRISLGFAEYINLKKNLGVGVEFSDYRLTADNNRKLQIIAYSLYRIQVLETNPFLFLKPRVGVGYNTFYNRSLLSLSSDIMFYVIKDKLNIGISIDNYYVFTKGWHNLNGLKIGFYF